MRILSDDEIMDKWLSGDMLENYREVANAQAELTQEDTLKEVGESITDRMHDNNFSSIVYFHPGKEHRDWKGRWVVGVQTGIDSDLICVKMCNTRGDEEKWLSPPGDNIIDALDKAVALLQGELPE